MKSTDNRRHLSVPMISVDYEGCVRLKGFAQKSDGELTAMSESYGLDPKRIESIEARKRVTRSRLIQARWPGALLGL